MSAMSELAADAATIREVSASPLEGRLEPEARDCGSPSDAALVSLAVSLKRIADAITGTEINQGIHAMIWEIANRQNFS